MLAATACDDKSPAAPTVPLDQQFTLAPAEAVVIAETSMRVQFVRVSGDSRCPADVVCILGGDAQVQIRAGRTGAEAEYELHTGDSSRASFVHAGYRIALVSLLPYPFSGRATQPDDYRATLTVHGL